jgi:transcriptional regulator with PAS, ATPase and Fis domain
MSSNAMTDLEDHSEATEVLDQARRVTMRMRALDITVLDGPDAGTSARVDRPTFVIGSGPGADLRLSDASVSREHLRLSLGADGVQLRDTGSKNGAWVGALRIGEVRLTADTNVRVGRTTLSLRLQASALELPLSEHSRFGAAIGVSNAMRHLFGLLERAAASDVTVLLEGESGVGKEVLASAIHHASARKNGPFVVVDCGAIPPTLIESELFGHERGAFTGAVQAHLGMFEQAREGTLFLDEIGELPLDLQPKLLRVLEQREVRPVGARAARSVNVRLVAATNRRLSESARKGEFRQDLFYRLAVARVTVPPLRDRSDDVVPLARAFLRTLTANPAAEVPPDLAAILASYAWPGNVRELRNVMERYALLGLRDAGGLFDESAAATTMGDLSHLPFQEARRVAIDRFERGYVPRVLERAGGVVARAAQLAEVARPSFYRMMERLRLPSDDDDDAC